MAHQDSQNGNYELGNIENGNGNSNGTYKDKPSHLDFMPRGKNRQRLPRGIKDAGESGRKGINPFKFLKIVARSSSHLSMAVNILWPFVPAAIAVYYTGKSSSTIFALNFLAMIPTANLIGFAGQELARKLPIVFGTILEGLLGSSVELVLLLILLLRQTTGVDEVIIQRHSLVIKDAILGSILANMLLCLGACFWVGGLREQHQKFDRAITEAGTGLLLVVGFALAIPAAFAFGVGITINAQGIAVDPAKEARIQGMSRATAIVLLIAFGVYIFYQMRTHHNLFAAVLERDEEQDKDGHHDRHKDKLTLTECFLALIIAFTLVCLHAFYLVISIDGLIADTGISEMFLGLILVPLVEKAAEHLTAVDEAWDNTPNLALSKILASTLQTALLNAPLIVLIAWGQNLPMDLNFFPVQVVALILAILVVGQFLRDGESNYLEGILCVMVYILIAVAAWYYPNNDEHSEGGSSTTEGGSTSTGEGTTVATEAAEHALVLARDLLETAVKRFAA